MWERIRTGGWQSRVDRIPVKRIKWYSPGDDLTGSHVVWEVRNFIDEAKREGLALDRIIFDQVDVVADALPLLAEDQLFWPTLLGAC